MSKKRAAAPTTSKRAARPKDGNELFNPDEWITQKEAAELRGVTIAAINYLIRPTIGRIRSVKDRYGKTLVNRADVMNFERRSPGPQPRPTGIGA